MNVRCWMLMAGAPFSIYCFIFVSSLHLKFRTRCLTHIECNERRPLMKKPQLFYRIHEMHLKMIPPKMFYSDLWSKQVLELFFSFYFFSPFHSDSLWAVYWLCYVLIIIFCSCSKFVVDHGPAAWQWVERLQNLKLDGFRIHLTVFVLFIHVGCLLLGWQWWAALKLNK